MKKENNKENYTDLEKCRDKINMLLKEYNCSLMSADEWHHVLIMDLDTLEAEGGFH